MIRVVIAEDQKLVLGAIAALLTLEGDFEVVGQATDGRSALEIVRCHAPDILVTDIEMPGLTGIELAARVARLDVATRVVIVTTFARPGYLRRALEAGAAGYLLKDAPADQLADGLRRVHRAAAPSIRNWPSTHGASATRSPTGSDKSSGSPARAAAAPRSARCSRCPTAPFATIYPRLSASSASAIASKRHGSRGRRVGCDEPALR